jgi:hypothetical protein
MPPCSFILLPTESGVDSVVSPLKVNTTIRGDGPYPVQDSDRCNNAFTKNSLTIPLVTGQNWVHRAAAIDAILNRAGKPVFGDSCW